MSTNDVPGANPINKDILAAGSWAEHKDGSLLFVKGNENGIVIYELFDVGQKPPVSYNDAMNEDTFKKQYSHPPIGVSTELWVWHDKTPFPWSRVMSNFEKPRPNFADVQEELSAAARVATSLKLRARSIDEAEITPKTEQVKTKRSVMERLNDAFAALID